MANEIYVSTQGDMLATHILSREIELLNHQRPFMRRLASFQGSTFRSGSSTIKKSQVDNDDIAETVAEGNAVSANTPLTDGSYTLTPSRRAIKRVLSNLLEGIDSTGLQQEAALALYNHTACMKAFDAAFATQLASLTGTAGSTGVAASITNVWTAWQTLNSRRARGKKALVLHPHQWNQLQSDLRNEVGPWQFDPQVGETIRQTSGDNFIGMLNDIELWQSNQVADANGGADHGGGMIVLPAIMGADGRNRGDAAIAFAEGAVSPVSMANNRMMPAGGVIYSDFKANTDKAEIEIVTNYFVSVAVADADKGIKFITDHE